MLGKWIADQAARLSRRIFSFFFFPPDYRGIVLQDVSRPQNTVINLYLATHHSTVTLQAISGLSPTTIVIWTLPYYEYTFTSI